MKRKHELDTYGVVGPWLREAEQIIAIIHHVVHVPIYLCIMNTYQSVGKQNS